MSEKYANLDKWLTNNSAQYYALPYYHIKKPKYLPPIEYVTLPKLFDSRFDAIKGYACADNNEIITEKLFAGEPLSVQTCAVFKVPNINEYISGKDIIEIINANVYNSHGIQDQILESDIEDDAYRAVDTGIKMLVDNWVKQFGIKNKTFMRAHFRSHIVGLEQLEDMMLIKKSQDTMDQLDE